MSVPTYQLIKQWRADLKERVVKLPGVDGNEYGPFIWNIAIPPPRTRSWRLRDKEIEGHQYLEWQIVLDCREYRHSVHMSPCYVCGKRHERPEDPDQRYAFNWYPQEPSVQAIRQWERRLREKTIARDLQEAGRVLA